MSLDDQFKPEGSEGTDELDLGVNLDEVPSQHAVPEGEHKLTLIDCSIEQQKPEKGTGKYIKALFEVAGDPDSKLITHVMMLPGSGDKDRQVKNRLRSIGDFYKAFNIPSSGAVQFSSYFGNEGWALLKIEDSADFGDQNRIRRFITGK